MKLYYVVGSPNCRKVHAVINHLGLDVKFEYLDFFTGELQGAYRAINPNAMVPSLVDGSLKLWESNAIMQYLADGPAGEAIFPRDRQQRADVVRWLAWELAHFNKALGILSFETVAKPTFMKQPPNKALVEISTSDLARFSPILDAHLDGRKFVSGATLTIADYALAHLESFKDAVPFNWSPYPRLNAYFERMRSVEHWAKTAPPSMEAVGRKPAGR